MGVNPLDIPEEQVLRVKTMPSEYVVRNFSEDSYYHVFNRGVEKRDIFLDDEDYTTLQSYLFKYLQPIEKIVEKYPDTPTRLYGKNLSEEVELVAYCLMPNHFDFLGEVFSVKTRG